MANWMKRRIQRSRARCHRTLLVRKQAAARNKSQSEADKQTTTQASARPIL